MTTLKQIYRKHGYEVNHDDQQGIGNKCLIEVEKCFIELLNEKLEETIKEQKEYNFDPIVPVVNLYEILDEFKHSPVVNNLVKNGEDKK
jgi:hypothetical protein